MIASIRLALRGIRRTAGYQLLVMALIAIPVFAGVFLAISLRSGQAPTIDGFNPGLQPEPGVTALRSYGGDELLAEQLRSRGLAANLFTQFRTEAPLTASVQQADWGSRLDPGVVHRVEGRMPSETGEIAITPDMAAKLELSVGDAFPTATDSSRTSTATVVGIATPVEVWGDGNLYLPPSAATGNRSTDDALLLIDAPSNDVLATLKALGIDDDSYRVLADPPKADEWSEGWLDPSRRPNQAGGILTAALLVETALLAAAAFAVGARRRISEVGRLSAIGLEPNQIKQTMLAEATLIGSVGAAIGTAVAVALAVLVPQLLNMVIVIVASRRADSAVLSGWDIATPAALAVVAAVLAAWLPARRAGDASPLAAIAGRSPLPPVRRHLALSGVTGLGLGWALVWLTAELASSSGGTRLDELTGLSAGICLLLGLLGLAAGVVQWLAHRAARLPLELRLGLRELNRNRLRAVATLGSSAIICAVAVLALTASISQAPSYAQSGPVSATPTVALLDAPGAEIWFDPGHLGLPRPPAGQVRSEFEANFTFDRDAKVFRAVSGGNDTELQLNVGIDDHSYREEVLTVATPELIEALALPTSIRKALARPNAVVVLNTAYFQDLEGRAAVLCSHNWPDTACSGPVNVVAHPADALQGLGLGSLIAPVNLPDGARPISTDQRLYVADQGFDPAITATAFVSVGSLWTHNPGSPQQRKAQLIALAIVMGLVAVIGRVAAGLIGAESAGDVAVMKAIGAPPRVGRWLLGAQIGWQVAIAITLAAPLAIALAWTLNGLNQNIDLVARVPLYLVAGLLFAPLVAAASVTATTGRTT